MIPHVQVYGDEAQFSKQGDQFLALLFTCPLHKVKGFLGDMHFPLIFCSTYYERSCSIISSTSLGQPWKKNYVYFILSSLYSAGQDWLMRLGFFLSGGGVVLKCSVANPNHHPLYAYWSPESPGGYTSPRVPPSCMVVFLCLLGQKAASWAIW